jgi:hypothetical protein
MKLLLNDVWSERANRRTRNVLGLKLLGAFFQWNEEQYTGKHRKPNGVRGRKQMSARSKIIRGRKLLSLGFHLR